MNQRAARARCTAALAALLAVVSVARPASAQTDRVYFPAIHDVRSVLLAAIRAETVRIDMGAWLLTEHMVSIALRDAFRRGVQVRLLGDRASIFETDPKTRSEYYWLASQGIPIRLRTNPDWFPEIVHWKATIFKGQGRVTFGSANYTANQLAPSSATNYSDETVLFTSDPSLVGAFLTRFDVMWNDSQAEGDSRVSAAPYLMNWDAACAAEPACASYRELYPSPTPMRISTARLEPDRPMPADLVWGQGDAFNDRLVREIRNESRLVRLVVYRLTAADVTQALLDKAREGVRVRLIIEPAEYTNRKWPEFWLTHANIDRLWAAGVQIRQRRHAGLTHMKMLVTSRYATNASSNYAANWQRDHNYFVPAAAKPSVHQAMASRFDTMWTSAEAFGPFVPGPADTPVLAAPAAGATGTSRWPTLSWSAAPFATGYDVYLGTSPSRMSLVGHVPAQLVNTPPSRYSWTAPTALAADATFYWRVVAKTHAAARDASLVAGSGTWSFHTRGASSDFLGNGKADFVVFRPDRSQWWIHGGAGPIPIGARGDVPASGDYDGDGRFDLAVWRPATGVWSVLGSASGYNPASRLEVQWGVAGDVPVPGDYDGDGTSDIAVWRPSTGVWWVLTSRSGFARSIVVQWGLGSLSDVPAPGDYDGDGTSDMAVWRPGTGTWWVLTSGSGFRRSTNVRWGLASERDVPVPADYDGDGRTDPAVWRPATGTWWVLESSTAYNRSLVVQWGLVSQRDLPAPADYDGDGLADIAVWRPASGTWWVLKSSARYAQSMLVQWGLESMHDVPANGSVPVAALNPRLAGY